MKEYSYENGAFDLGISEGFGSRDPHRPTPDPYTGALVIDPDIVLKAQAFDLRIDFFYSTEAAANLEYGFGRSASVRAYARHTAGAPATLCRGDFTQHAYSQVSASGGVENFVPVQAGFYTGGLNTLSFDGTTFTEYFSDGMQMRYASTGAVAQKYELSAVVHPSGAAHTYTYGTGAMLGLLQTIEEPAGRKVTFSYTPSLPTSLVASVVDWAGRAWSFGYDASRFLVSYTTPIGCETRYGYLSQASSTPGVFTLVASIEDARGFVACYLYDAKNRVTTMAAGAANWTWSYGVPANTMKSPTGALTTSAYDETFFNPLATQYPEGFTATYGYLPNRLKVSEVRPSGSVYSVTYTPDNQVATSADALGNITTFQRDSVGNLTTTIDAMGNSWLQEFDANRNVVGTTDPLGRKTTSTFDSFSNRLTFQDGRSLVTSWLYDPFGNPTTQMNSDGGVVQNVFDNLGRVIATTDPIQRTTSYAYDLADHVISMTNAAGETQQQIFLSCLLQAAIDPLGFRTSFTYGRYLNQLTVQNALGHVFTNRWDSMGYQAGTIDALGNQTTAVFNLAKQKTADIDQLGFPTSYFYDVSGRPLATQNARGFLTSNVWNARDIIATQDPLGNLSTATFDPLDRVIAQQTPLGHVSSNAFDAAGQNTASIDPFGFPTTSNFDGAGNQISQEDPNGFVNSFIYSPSSNRLAATQDALGFVTTYATDLAGQGIARINASGHAISFGFDLAGRECLLVNELGYATTTSFDAGGRPASVIQANNWHISYAFDAVGQKLATVYGDGTVTQGFDAIGRRTTMQDETGTTTYAYSPRSELLLSSSPGNVLVSYQYDSVGMRSLMVDPDGGVESYTRDALNRVSVQSSPDGMVYSSQYDADSNLTTLLYGGSSRQIAYDALGRIATQIEFAGTTPISTIVDTCDPGGRKIAQVRDGVLASYAYDRMTHLIGQQKAGAYATFAYDRLENQILKWHQGSLPATSVFDNANRNYKVQDGAILVTNGYQPNGNLSVRNHGDMVTSFTFNRRNREKLVTNPDGTLETMLYDGDGLRRVKHTASALTTFVWDGTNYLGELS